MTETRNASQLDAAQLKRTLDSAKELLLSKRMPLGHWQGTLSGSALSTATAAFAVSRATQTTHEQGDDSRELLVRNALDWVCRNQNTDGGWGDTIKSVSNLSTTALCWAALTADLTGRCRPAREKAAAWIAAKAGGLEPASLAEAIAARYGRDRTFCAPILSMLALAGELGDDPWRHVTPLPFELAALPHQLFRFLRLQVVSYALPALIAVGQARFRQRPPAWPVRLVRGLACESTLRLLATIQPQSGGYLEACPLTSFVLMNLTALGQNGSTRAVTRRGLEFLRATVRPDGSWPIDTNLATWVTTLSVNALAAGDDFDQRLGRGDRRAIGDWLLAQQHRREHPYTHAAPGGWAWTDLSGGVPDADDTAGALLALRRLAAGGAAPMAAVTAAVEWLLGLQNSDGGIPTFCRGWGKLPFDRSSADLTAHTLQAWACWRGDLPPAQRPRVDRAAGRAERFLARSQQADGRWNPLWFGNQHARDETNPVYGTSRVLMALRAGGSSARSARAYLLAAQNGDGGWGGAAGAPSSIEETSLAVDALSRTEDGQAASQGEDLRGAACAGANYLIEATRAGTQFDASPIGLYFAKLWYFEELYPVIFCVSALNRLRRAMG